MDGIPPVPDIADPPEDLLPPYAKATGFREIGERMLRAVRELAGLTPDQDVFDLGSGIGRFALPLTRFLSPTAVYRGLDVDDLVVGWCRDNITPVCSNFRFEVLDVWNGKYNPNGAVQASEASFPYSDRSFDFVFHASVFTHMMPVDVDNYVKEIARVLRPGGRCMFSLFWLDEVSIQILHEGKARWPVLYNLGVCSVRFVDRPEAVVAYEGTYMKELLDRYGFRFVSIDFGRWAPREGAGFKFGNQDVVVAEKR